MTACGGAHASTTKQARRKSFRSRLSKRTPRRRLSRWWSTPRQSGFCRVTARSSVRATTRRRSSDSLSHVKATGKSPRWKRLEKFWKCRSLRSRGAAWDHFTARTLAHASGPERARRRPRGNDSPTLTAVVLTSGGVVCGGGSGRPWAIVEDEQCLPPRQTPTTPPSGAGPAPRHPDAAHSGRLRRPTVTVWTFAVNRTRSIVAGW